MIVRVEQFDGPLDLLLDLIKKEELDITKISLAKVTDQYLSYLEKIKEYAADEVADFLLVAAKLVFIKSRALLPIIDDDEEGESDLLEQLKIYKEYLDASKSVNKLINKNNFLFTRKINIKDYVVFSPPKTLDKISLLNAFDNFLNKSNDEDVELNRERMVRKISIQSKIKEIGSLLKNKKRVTWNDVFSKYSRKDEKVVGFLAVLELVRSEDVTIKQDRPFSDIFIQSM